MAKSPLRAFLLHNVVAPYRLPVFEELSRHLDLDVAFCKTITADRKWDATLDGYTFNRQVLPDFAVGPFFINPTLLWRLLRKRYDVYLVGDFPEMAFATFVTIMVAKFWRKPIVLWSETVDHEVIYFQHLAVSTKRWHRAVRRVLTGIITHYRRFLLRLPDQYVALSDLAEAFLLREGIDAVKIHTGIQVMPKELLVEPSVDKAKGRYADQKLVLYLGYFNPMKGIDILIRAFGKVKDPQARLAIVGAGPEEANLRTLARHDRRVEFLGYVDSAERANLMHWADVVVLPTLADCWAFVVNESLYYGTPVITTSAAGAAQLLADGKSGIVIPPRDEASLVLALENLLGDPKHYRRMAAATRKMRDVITDTRVGAQPILEAFLAAGAQPTSASECVVVEGER